ncbi:MAG: acyltransferase [Prevotellaceae bacterium]|jgi:hypothetical protein|nr:acyltransferase [Prevotellaceae bacterium]
MEKAALDCFRYQAARCYVYKRYIELLDVNPDEVTTIDGIPFLPIEFFKTSKIYSAESPPEAVFTSSGTGGEVSRHYVADLEIYRRSYIEGFRLRFGCVSQYAVLALLPSYLEREGSSLIEMVSGFIALSQCELSGFYLNNHEELYHALLRLKEIGQKTLLIGVSFALLDFAERYTLDFPELVVMETGGMKGRRREITRDELHDEIRRTFGLAQVHSEYGMTELLSQAYSVGGRFRTPPWMRISMRDPHDPFRQVKHGATGGINVIDLANIFSCSFIETQDLGIMHADGSFEVTGRFDQSELRGCNLMMLDC